MHPPGAGPFTHIPTHVLNHPFTFQPPTHPFIHLPTHPPTSPPIHQPTHTFIHQSTNPPTYLPVPSPTHPSTTHLCILPSTSHPPTLLSAHPPTLSSHCSQDFPPSPSLPASHPPTHAVITSMADLNEPESLGKTNRKACLSTLLVSACYCPVSLHSQALSPDTLTRTFQVSAGLKDLPKLGPPEGHTLPAPCLQPVKRASGMAWRVAHGLHGVTDAALLLNTWASGASIHSSHRLSRSHTPHATLGLVHRLPARK